MTNKQKLIINMLMNNMKLLKDNRLSKIFIFKRKHIQIKIIDLKMLNIYYKFT